MPTAQIILRVTTFRDIYDGSATKAYCITDEPQIADYADGRLIQPFHGDTRLIRFNRGKENLDESAEPVDITYTIEPAAHYKVAGVMINKHGLTGNGKEPNFSIVSMVENKLTLRNHYRVGEQDWQVLIGIQEKAISGRVGIIDPGVENSEQE